MSLTPTLTSPLGPGLIPIVLSDPNFASRGYIWGHNGNTWYCFVNPKKLNFDIWKKRYTWWAFAIPVIAGLIAGAAGGSLGLGVLAAFETIIIPLMLVKHYARTGEAQNAVVVTNGPQMELPGNMQFGTVFAITAALMVGGTGAGALIGAIVGTLVIPGIGAVAGWLWGALLGVISGANLVALFLFLLGLGATPFGSVFGLGFSENGTSNSNSYHLGRQGTGFAAHQIGPLDPIGLLPGCGGLIAMIINGAPADLAVKGTVGALYLDLVANPRNVVTWGLLPFSEPLDGFIIQAMESQAVVYDGDEPFDGLILVVGAEGWGRGHTASMISTGVKNAVATDGSLSAMMGSESEWVIGAPDITNLSSYRDPIQRYGFKVA